MTVNTYNNVLATRKTYEPPKIALLKFLVANSSAIVIFASLRWNQRQVDVCFVVDQDSFGSRNVKVGSGVVGGMKSY